MASSSPLEDIEENFFICPVCLDYFREPKVLPCLHRFCKGCLHDVIEQKNGAFDCPMCKQPCAADSVDEFKTDFYVKSILEFIQLKRTFEQKDGRECVGCSLKKRVEAYCFECGDFLCEQCFQFHSTNKMLAKHVKHLLNMKNIGAKCLTLEKLASLSGAPRCNTHPDHVAQLLCGTCGNVPICVACTYGKHKGHEFHEVTTLADTLRKDLVKKLKELEMYKDKIYKLPREIEITRNKLEENVLKEKERLKLQLDKQVLKIDEDIRRNDCVLALRRMVTTRERDEECSRLRRIYEKKFEQLRRELQTSMQEAMRKYSKEFRNAENEHSQTETKLHLTRSDFDGDFNSSIMMIDEQKSRNELEIKEILELTNNTIIRYENVTATSSAVLASKDDWLDAQCIPNIEAACEPLAADVKEKFQNLKYLSDIIVPEGLPKTTFDNKMAGKSENMAYFEKKPENIDSASAIPRDTAKPVVVNNITIKDIEISVIIGKDWYNVDLATCERGSIVVTSKAPDEYSYITVLNKYGTIQRQEKIKAKMGFNRSWRFSSWLSQSKFISVMQGTEIGIYDISDGTYIMNNFKFSGTVSCLTTDHLNKHVYVGCYHSKRVEVFDDKLNNLHQLFLPYTPNCLNDISIHERKFFICDRLGKRAYAAIVEGQNLKKLYEFANPYDDKGCFPRSVCSDISGIVYILWGVSGLSVCTLARYSRYGSDVLTTTQVDGDARRVRMLKDHDGEKVLVSTESTGKVFVVSV